MACIIFDFDGTLADTKRGIIETFKRTMQELGLPVATDEQIADTIGLPLVDSFMKLSSLTEEDALGAAAHYRSIFFDVALSTTVLFPGVDEALEEMWRRKVPMAIASSRGEPSLRELSSRLGISRYFDESRIYGLERVTNHKPAPDLVNLILDQMGASPSSTLVVGDTVYDVEMGRGAGCYTCAVTYGNHSRDRLAVSRPDYMIDDLRQLL